MAAPSVQQLCHTQLNSPVDIVVEKSRHLFLHGNTRIHLDEVDGLGSFLELEAVYLHGRMMVVLAARPKPPWQGVLLPLEREHHASILEEFPALSPHPVLPKWLYLPERHDEFEEVVTQIVACIAEDDPRFGIEPRPPRKRKKKRA